jgi:cell division protein FtsB
MTFRELLHSKFVSLIGLVLIIGAGFSLARELKRRAAIQREIHTLEEEANRLTERRQELRTLSEYIGTPEYREREAREKLGLAREGEHVVIFPSEEQSAFLPSNLADGDSVPNPLKWWWYFFGAHE